MRTLPIPGSPEHLQEIIETEICRLVSAERKRRHARNRRDDMRLAVRLTRLLLENTDVVESAVLIHRRRRVLVER